MGSSSYSYRIQSWRCRGNWPIGLAACQGSLEVVRMLMPFTENPNAPNKVGDTPIKVAAQFGYLEMV